MDLFLIERYKKLFQIGIPISEFSAKELKRRWKILNHKYHPDHGGKSEHFIFVQTAYKYLKQFCSKEEVKYNAYQFYNKKVKDNIDNVYNRYGIREIKVKVQNGEDFYLWEIEGVDTYV
jgi:DnaJ-class molecular chaperone